MNLCSSKPASSYVVYGDWIYLNGTSRALLAYKVRKLFNLFELFHATEMRYLSHYCFAIIYSNNHLEKPTDKSHLRNKERFWSDKGNFQVHQFKLEWQCFTTDSSSWRRAIGNGWANVIKEESDMQEKFKMFGKSHQTPAFLLKILFLASCTK